MTPTKRICENSAAPLVEITNMYAAKELYFEVERASKAANESKVNASATGIAMYQMTASAYGIKTRTDDRATGTWLIETREGLKSGSLKMTSILLEKLALEGVHTEETSFGTLGEISFKYCAQSDRKIRTVSEFFTMLARWARGVLTAGTSVVGEDGCGPGVGTMGDHGTVGAAASSRRLHVKLTEVFALLQYHFATSCSPTSPWRSTWRFTPRS